jgi:LPS export ABC transporter permease LptG
MKLLDRYVLRNFLEPFLICLTGFVAIWLIFDYSDNSNDFIQAHASFAQIGAFYATQLPATLLLSLPIGLLLALLYSLSSMSRRNEIISMLTAGRSVYRVLVPLLLIGVLLSGLCLWLNWDMAPHAETIRKTAMRQLKRGRKADGTMEMISGHVFRDRQNFRTWYVRKLKPGSNNLQDVHITQQTADGTITHKYYAERASFDPDTGRWVLRNGLIAEFDTATGEMVKTDSFPHDTRLITTFSETPWRIASSQLDAGGLSVEELHSYLRHNADFPSAQLAPYRTNLSDRYAYPLTCFIVVLMAAPLGIVFNRRGVLGGVATALTLFVVILLSRYLVLAFGKGDRLPPFYAPWFPIAFGTILGIILLWFRSTGRDLPRLSWKRK